MMNREYENKNTRKMIGNRKRLGKHLAGLVLAGIVGILNVFTVFAAEETLEAPENARWNSTVETTASWKKVKNATGYQLRLYYDDEYFQTVHVSTNRADLSSYMTREGWYYYEVRAVAENKAGTKYMGSSEYTLSEDLVLKDLGETDGTWRNYVAGKKFQKEDDSYAQNGWLKILGKWYYFDENGYMVTGWRLVRDTWYHMDSYGVMETGWIEEDGCSYYLDSSGAMQTGWLQLQPGRWCYFYQNGSMAKDAVVDGYVIGADGIWTQN